MSDLSSPTRDRTCTPCIGGEVLTTGPPRKSPQSFYHTKKVNNSICNIQYIIKFPQSFQKCLTFFQSRAPSFICFSIQNNCPAFFFFFNLFIYLFLAALGLCCCAWAFCGGFSCCRARALGVQALVVVARGLSSCGSQALEHRLSSCGAWA